MNKSKTIRSIQCSILLAMTASPLVAAPYGPEGRAITWDQPGGSTIQLRVFGDEYFARTETLTGHTVTFENGAYYYARTAADGSTLESTGVLADRVPPAGLTKHLKMPNAAVEAIRSENRAKYDGARQTRWNQRQEAAKKLSAPGARLSVAEAAEAELRAAPLTGNVRGLTILVQFPADSENPGNGSVSFPTTRAKIVDYCNKVGYKEDGNTGSIRDYFHDQSLGRLTYTQKVTAIVTLPNPRNYYNFSDYPANRTFNDEAGRLLLREALATLVKSKYDFSGLTMNGDREVLATNIFFAGPDSGRWSQGLWPHQWALGLPYNVGTSQNPIYINQYQITNLDDAAPVIGTFCHESGHLILDYPDLYDYGVDGASAGVGEHCLMGGGNHVNGGRTPMPINAHFKDLAGWGNVVDLSPDQFLSAKLRSTGNRAYRILRPGAPSELFMVENRGAGDKWAAGAPDKGIAIWHVDDRFSGNEHQQREPDRHYQVSLEQADGNYDMERNPSNRGDSRDLFDVDTPIFSATTRPNSNWWDNSRSNVRVQVFSKPRPVMELDFGVVPPNTIILSAPNGGEMIYPTSKYKITWKANITGRVKIDLLKGGVFHSKIASNVPNNGLHEWLVPQDLAKGDDYSVRISSLTNAVATRDASNSLFRVNNVTFPVRAEMPYGWYKPQGYATTFGIDKKNMYEGKSSLVTRPTNDGSSCAIAYTSDFVAGEVSFYIKVSSELGFDIAKFYIDGVAQEIEDVKEVSGNVDWVFVKYPISAGTHTLMWTYSKDDSYGGFNDKVWIDGLALPATTQEIAVRNPQGIQVNSGVLAGAFEDVAMGSKSQAHTFTIRNHGNADLHSLKISKSGADSGDFEIIQPKKKAIAPGAKTTFQVLFTPKGKGAKNASIVVHSNDRKNSRFVINVQGKGLGLPKMLVSQPATKKLTKGTVKTFGPAKVGTIGKSRIFTIRNSGVSVLKNLKIGKAGANPRDFRISRLGATSLAPGESTTFTVTFRPRKAERRLAQIQITSSDKKTGLFAVEVSGRGTARKGGKKNSVAALAAVKSSGGGLVEATLGKQSGVEAVSSVDVVSGVKYRSLTIAKVNGANPGTVEVSSNLLDWFSGKKHTTVLLDDAKTLKVRDNTPLQPGTKRYIRLK